MENLKLLKKNKILIIAAHPDDEMLGCGGTIIKLKEKNEINVVFLTNGISARTINKKKAELRKNECLNLFKDLNLPKPIMLNFSDNQLDKIPLLKIIKKIELIIKKIQPNIIFTHYENCLNIDHQITYRATITACRPLKTNPVKTILCFEVLSSTDWAIFEKKSFQPNLYINITKQINNKLKFLKYYKSEIKKYPHSRSLKALEALAKIRGTSSGYNFAEAFYLVRHLD
jgi:LmbE family N-acetylglucosaminyl deacetylase